MYVYMPYLDSSCNKYLSDQVTIRKEDIQNLLRRLMDSQTILVGHSLDSDLKVPSRMYCMYVYMYACKERKCVRVYVLLYTLGAESYSPESH